VAAGELVRDPRDRGVVRDDDDDRRATFDEPLTPPVFSDGSALLCAVTLDVAATVTSPLLALVVPSSAAVVSRYSMFTATDPATPTVPPPAPLVALAPSSWVEAMSASIVRPFAVTTAFTGRIARLRICA